MNPSITFRKFQANDINLYCQWKNQPEIWQVDELDDFKETRPEEIRDWFNQIVAGGLSYMILMDNTPIGYVGFKSIDEDAKTAEFLIVLGELSTWSQGYGKVAMGWLFDRAFDHLRLESIFGYVFGNNTRALKFFQKLGFEIAEEWGEPFFRDGESYPVLKIVKGAPSAI